MSKLVRLTSLNVALQAAGYPPSTSHRKTRDLAVDCLLPGVEQQNFIWMYDSSRLDDIAAALGLKRKGKVAA